MLNMQKLGMKQNKVKIMKILFVCTGNTCRSPMAEALAKILFPKYDFVSAGLYVNPTDSVSANAVLAMKNYGIDISEHKPTQLTVEKAAEYDYIIPMTSSHKQILLANGINPDKILMFKEEISDPFGQNLETYLSCAEQLKNNIKITIGELNEIGELND